MQGAQPKGHVGVPRPTSTQLDGKPEPNSHRGVPRSALDHPATISTSATNILLPGNAAFYFSSKYNVLISMNLTEVSVTYVFILMLGVQLVPVPIPTWLNVKTGPGLVKEAI